MAPEKKSLEEIRETPEFKQLTQKQQLFLCTYVSNGYDAIAATRTAYAVKSAENARVLSYAMLGNIKIIAILNIHFGVSPTEELLTAIDRAIRNKKVTLAQVYALRTKLDVLGISTRLPTIKEGQRGIDNAQKAVRKSAKPEPAEKPAPGPTFHRYDPSKTK